ncbi:flagellar hook-basal body complex protein FliE [Treponema phagedenis]|uniref:Flagellar hook-basal body complex protein FliE n=1 Tax=Treponema phagedenis TaxID=162 RepID=A0A0B7GQV1_TREPH|nr:flagellar hook-basal body complex protein FliE [Treponema phagedenis]EFW39284.1 flagellar hook-basal body complex protein FliE [Treponema phagedenis F0421]NVP24548.1 flagellar hook-basal body complex protein FliE [Treponema phagedenis]QEJ94755.1 flagellar hook-basal body complex protein FliE [Treponema phagedenis]QEJ97692.1 flagellar hook-basal body complex protein FliE [Treponema phagedenis]QEK00661.1 flagellar hook-basal body complex protein FliE [Treponema phagedenis]
MIGTITNVANVYKVPSLEKVPEIEDVSMDNFRSKMKSTTDSVDLAVNKKAMSFEQTLLKAFDSVNAKQQKTTELTEQMIVNPDSVDVHDVTIAMAEAGMSLKIAQTVIDKVIKSWNDITTTR